MADIRINALATTATASASDDYIAIDGAANGTRKLSVYSPTFGGNLTVSGGQIVTASSTDLTLQGGSNGALLVLGQGSGGNIKTSTSNTNASPLFSFLGGPTSNGFKTRFAIGCTGFTGFESLAPAIAAVQEGAVNYSGLAFEYYGLGVRTEGMRLNSSGNLLLGTTTDSSNGKLQLATHTTSAGGIGFGTGISFYSSSSNKLAIYNSSQPTLEFVDATKSYGRLETAGGSFYISSADASASLVLRSGNATTALTLDSSQNATFAGTIKTTGTGDGVVIQPSSTNYPAYVKYTNGGGNLFIGLDNNAGSAFGTAGNYGTVIYRPASTGFAISRAGTADLSIDSSGNATFAGTIKPQQAATASAPTYVKGAIYFDTTLNKLRVGGATGWETITSI